MSTAYKHTMTMAVPESMKEQANQMACVFGRSKADLKTFGDAGLQDSEGNLYCCISTAVTEGFLAMQGNGFPEALPAHAVGLVDAEAAREAFESIGKPGGIRMIVDVPALEALELMGLVRVEVDLDEPAETLH